MSDYAQKLRHANDMSFPPNPCKLLRIWIDDGKEKYDEVIAAMFMRDDLTNQLYELEHVARVLTDDLEPLRITRNDVWKHRKGQCNGCSIMANRIVTGLMASRD